MLMGFFDSIIALALAVIGSFAFCFLGWTLVMPILAVLGVSSNKLRAAKPRGKYRKHVTKIDRYIESDRYDLALKEIEKAVILTTGRSENAINEIRDHNQTILSRAIIVSEQFGGRIHNLPDVERLLLERSEIQLIHLKTKDSLKNISKKRGKAGKKLPEWSTSEFKKKLSAIEEKLSRNKQELESALKQLFSAIRKPSKPQSGDITYH